MIGNMVKRATAETTQGQFVASTLDSIPAPMKVCLLNAGKLALSGLKKGRHVFRLQDMQQTCGDFTHLSGLLEEFRTVSVRGECHEAQFCHLTYQEFLAAYYVSQSDGAELESCGREIGFGEAMWPFWRFAGGLFGPKKVTTLLSILIDASDENVLSAKKWEVLKMICFAEAMTQPCPDDEDTEKIRNFGREAAKRFFPTTLDLSFEAVSVSDMHAVSLTLAFAEHVNSVQLFFCDLGERHANGLRTHVGLRYVRSLMVAGNPGLHGNGLSILASAFGLTGPLLWLNLAECRLDNDDCASLCDILRANPSLHQLSLSRNAFSATALDTLRPVLSCSVLEVIVLQNTSLDAECGRIIGQVLAQSDHLRVVDLCDNPLGNDSVVAVLQGALHDKPGRRHNCRTLVLSNTGIDDRLLNVLPAVLQNSPSTLPGGSAHPDSGQSHMSLDIWLGGNDISLASLRQLAEELPLEHVVHCGM